LKKRGFWVWVYRSYAINSSRVIPQKIIEVLSRGFYDDRRKSEKMKKSRFTDTQIMAILKQHESRVPVAELCRERNVSTALSLKERLGMGDYSPIHQRLGAVRQKIKVFFIKKLNIHITVSRTDDLC
jgi:putative transposase